MLNIIKKLFSWWNFKGIVAFRLNLISKTEIVGSRAYFGAITAVISVLAGVWASIFTDDIKSSVLLFPFLTSSLNWSATSFWILVFLAGLCFGIAQWAQARKSGRATGKLEAMVAKLETLPTGNFLPNWQESCRISLFGVFYSVLNKSQTISGVEEVIIMVLDSIIQTAQQFDKVWDNTEYAASIMIWRPVDKNHWVKLETANPTVTIPWFQGDQRAIGVLELIPSLSTTALPGASTLKPDARCVNLVMPVPALKNPVIVKNKEMSPILPGAVWAFCREEMAQFTDVSKYVEWLEKQTSIDPHSAKAMTDYFHTGKGQHIKSFCSLPIILPHSSPNIPIAVLNIHSTDVGLLAENGQTLFAPLLEPFLNMLSILLVERERLQNGNIAAVSAPPSPTSVP